MIYDETTLDKIFLRLNQSNCDYLVLRNYEQLLPFPCFIDGDIDFLCYNRKQFVQILGAKKRENGLNAAHYEIFVQGRRIEIDVREVGDGYYCKQWEADCLKNKVLYNEKFYVMDRENYYFSLIYHCLIHKGQISDKYFEKINFLYNAKKTQEELRNMLFDFMKQKNYKVTNSSDWELNVHYDGVSKDLISQKKLWKIKRLFFRRFKV